jgi:hypothetical protein
MAIVFAATTPPKAFGNSGLVILLGLDTWELVISHFILATGSSFPLKFWGKASTISGHE